MPENSIIIVKKTFKDGSHEVKAQFGYWGRGIEMVYDYIGYVLKLVYPLVTVKFNNNAVDHFNFKLPDTEETSVFTSTDDWDIFDLQACKDICRRVNGECRTGMIVEVTEHRDYKYSTKLRLSFIYNGEFVTLKDFISSLTDEPLNELDKTVEDILFFFDMNDIELAHKHLFDEV